MDLNRVIGEVAARHGVRLDPDDPALVLVTVTELMLQQAQEEFLASARRAMAEFVEAAGRAQEQAGAVLAESVRKTCGTHRAESGRILTPPEESQDSPVSLPTGASRARLGRWAVSALVAGVLFLTGMLVGRVLSV